MKSYLKGLSKGTSLNQKPKRSKFAQVFLRKVKPEIDFTSSYLLNLIKIFLQNKQKEGSESKIESINIYDIGCGPCKYIFSKLYNGIKLNYTGVDRGSTYYDYIKRIGGELITADLEEPLVMIDSESADLIICSHVIEHINNLEDLISELYRILKPEGLIFFRTPDIENIGFKFYSDYTHVRPFTTNSLKEYLTNSGFKLIYSKSVTPLRSVSTIVLKRLPFSIERISLFLLGIISQLFLKKRREVEALAYK